MVKNLSASFAPRDTYSPSGRQDQWAMSNNDRYMSDSPINANHFPPLSNTRSSETPQAPAIETALRERCGIGIKDFVMIATLEDGSTATFTSEKLRAQEKFLFNKEFRETYFQTLGYASYPRQSNYNDFDPSSSMRRQSSSTESSIGHRRQRTRSKQESFPEDSDDEDDDNMGTVKKGRKRLRGSAQEDDEDEKPPSRNIRTRNLRIADTDEVTRFFEGRFRDMQQAACKIIAKAFVKVVEPRKQTNYPYTGGAERAPLWWPPMPVEGQPGGVKHKEPDHLLKPERIRLLVHILRIGQVREYNKEHVTIQALQDKTKEAMLTWFNDKPENGAKENFLKEIFKVARAEERYRKGEIDGTFSVPVMHGTDQGVPDMSDDEAEDTANDEDEEFAGMTPQSTQILTPDSMVSPISTHSHTSLTRPLSGNSVTGFGNYHQREMPIRQQYSNAAPNSNLLPKPEDPYDNESMMGVPNFLSSRPNMGYMQHHPTQNHGLPEQGRRPSYHPAHTFPTGSSSAFANWSNSNMIPVPYSPYPSQTPTPLASNRTTGILPLPSSQSSTSLLPPMHPNQQQHNQAFNEPSPQSMNFRTENMHVNQQQHSMNNSLRTTAGGLSNPHHQQQYHHAHQPSYNMNEYMHDYGGHPDAVMKDEHGS